MKREKKKSEEVERKLQEIEKLKEENDLRRREMEEKKKQEQEQGKGTIIDKIMPIQVEESDHPVDEEEGEQLHYQELTQQIEQIIEEMDTYLEQELQDKDNDLMPRASKVTLQSPPPSILELVPSKK